MDRSMDLMRGCGPLFHEFEVALVFRKHARTYLFNRFTARRSNDKAELPSIEARM